MSANPLQPAPGASDVINISDAVLSDRLFFVNEIGSGNWGSVWLCKPKPEAGQDGAPSAPERLRIRETKLAVKLVHRAKANPATEEEKKTAETASKRVKTLWSEMKIVRTLNEQPHPSIIHFQSFIITPSFAMIAMPFLPQLIPVEVPELRAKEWLHSLLSGVAFIHQRGVVHNDIKPANIMISSRSLPVLIDFGFAEQYDETEKNAFMSNLHYGTPEYISPERAEGVSHDTRKSDVWSLGITFFEILVGRTPFEEGENETFLTTEDLKKYWRRTATGQWVGVWKISNGAEHMLRGMLNPDPSVRYTATTAMEDQYWTASAEENAAQPAFLFVPPTPSRATSRLSSREPQKRPSTRPPSVLELLSPWASRSSRRASAKENAPLASAKHLSAAVSTPRLEAETVRRRGLELSLKQAHSHGRMPSEGRAVPVPVSILVKPELKKKPTMLVARAVEAETKTATEAGGSAMDATPEKKRPLSPAVGKVVLVDKPTPVTPPNPDAPRRRTPKTHERSQSAVVTSLTKPASHRRKGDKAHAITPKPIERRVFLTAKENVVPNKPKAVSPKDKATPSPSTRRPLGPRPLGSPANSLRGVPAVLADRTSAVRRAANTGADAGAESDGTCELPSGALAESVARRMHDWEAERARMRRAMLGGSDDESEVAVPAPEQQQPSSPAPPPPPAKAVPPAVARMRDWEQERARMRSLIAPITDDESTGVIGVAEVRKVDAVAAAPAKPMRIEPQAVSRMRDWEQERARMRAMLAGSSEEGLRKKAEKAEAEALASPPPPPPPPKPAASRMRDWEAERARMRAMLGDSDDEPVKPPAPATPPQQAPSRQRQPTDTVRTASTLAQDVQELNKKSMASLGPPRVKASRQVSLASSSSSPVLASFSSRAVLDRLRSHYDESTASTVVDGEEPALSNGSTLNILKQSLKLPMSRRSTSASAVLFNENGKRCLSPVESWTDIGVPEEEEEQGGSSREKHDRMMAWARSVDKVVKDTRMSFALSTPHAAQLPPPPPSTSRRPSVTLVRTLEKGPSRRMQRRIPSVSSIFNPSGGPATPVPGVAPEAPKQPSQLPFPTEAASPSVPETTHTPRRRRNTIETRSPKPSGVGESPVLVLESPSKQRKERWRSQGNLLDCKIVPSEILSAELDRSPPRKRPQRLSALVDGNALFANLAATDGPRTPPARLSRGSNDLLASPFHVEPYQPMHISPAPDSPSRRHAQTAYDQLVMSSTGVKRVGQGYQSATPPVTKRPIEAPSTAKRGSRFMKSTRKPMPPPVSSDDVRRPASVDEFGRMSRGAAFSPPASPTPDGGPPTVWRAFKAVVTGKTSRRASLMPS